MHSSKLLFLSDFPIFRSVGYHLLNEKARFAEALGAVCTEHGILHDTCIQSIILYRLTLEKSRLTKTRFNRYTAMKHCLFFEKKNDISLF